MSPLVSKAQLTWRHYFWGFRPFKRHSLVLMVAGLGYILTGATYVITKSTLSRREALAVALQWFPLPVWGGVFILVGFLAMVSSRWPPVTEIWGYMLLTGLSAGWAATYAAGVILKHAPTGNFSATLQWGLLAFLWIAITGFVDPDKTVVVVIKDDECDDNS